MKTTLELPDELLRRTKAEAASDGTSMKDFVTDALEEKLRSRRRKPGGGWRAVFGRAKRAATRDVQGHMIDFERIRPEDWK